MSKRKSGAGPSGQTPEIIAPPAGADEPTADAAPPAADSPTITMYSPDGSPVSVSATDAPELYRAGKLGFADGQTVNVSKGGKVYAFTPDKLDAAFDNGYSVASEDQVKKALENKEFAGFGKTLEAGALGVGRGLTLGLQDPLAIGAARAIGGDEAAEKTRRELSLSREHHPYVSTGGELVGAIAPVVASGGAGAEVEGAGLLSRAFRTAGAIPRAAAKAGEIAEGLGARVVGRGAPGLLGKVAQRAIPTALQAGTEGAIYGTGATISEAALGDEELTAEKLMAGATHGFKLGAIAGGVLGGGYEVGKAAVDRGLKIIGKEGLSEFLRTAADRQTISALGANVSDMKAMGGITRSTEKMEERVASIADTVRNYHLENGEKVFTGTSTTAKLSDKLSEAVEEAGEKLGKFREKVSSLIDANPELSPDVMGYLERVKTEITDPLRAGNLPENFSKANSALSKLSDRVQAGERVSIDELGTIRREFDTFLHPPKTGLAGGGISVAPVRQAELFKATRMLEDTIEEATDRAVASTGNHEMVGAYDMLKQQYRNLSDARKIAGAADMRAMSRNSISLSDKMAAGSMLAAGGIGGIPGAVGAGLLNHLGNTYGNAASAVVLDKAAQIIAMQRAIHHMDREVTTGINAFLSDTHETAELAEKLGHVSREAGKTALEAKERGAGGTGEAAEIMSRRRSDYEKQTADAATATQEHAIAMSQAVAQHAPNTAIQLQNKAGALQANLAKQIPAGVHQDAVLIPNKRPTVSDTDIQKYNSYQEVAKGGAPVVLRKMQAGTLTPIHVQALNENYPKHAPEVKKQIVEAVTSRSKPISYEKRKQLSILLGTPVDQTQTPSFHNSVQEIYAPKQQSGGSAPKRPLKQRSQLTSTQELTNNG